MNYLFELDSSNTVAVIQTDTVLLADEKDAVDFIANVHYQTGCDCVILPVAAFPRAFFVLSNGLAGRILQKFVTYSMRLAIVGDFSGFTGKSLQDFIRESNKGRHVNFFPTSESAIQK